MYTFARLIMVPLSCLVLLASPFCLGDVGAEQVQVISGDVVDIDWVGSKFTVRYDDDRLGYGIDEMTFTATSDTKVLKGTEEIGFLDVNQGDRVTVEYVANSFTGLQAVRIIVNM